MKKIFNVFPWVTIGQIIGVFLIIPLGYHLINKYYYNGIKYNTDADLHYKTYIKDSDTLYVNMPKYGSNQYLYNLDIKKSYESFQIHGKKGLTMDDFIHAEYIPFYDNKNKKYFNIMSFADYSYSEWEGKEVKLWVNKEDLNNPEYGTKDNPVPVLQAQGVKSSIRANNLDYDTTYMDSFYRNNVIRYLKYKMPKEEFERRFKHKE